MATNFFKNLEERMFLNRFKDIKNLRNASTKDQMRWFELINLYCPRIEALEKGYISQEAICAMWEKHFSILAPYISRANEEQFKVLLQTDNYAALDNYVLSHTLSLQLLENFIKHIMSVEENGPKETAQWLLNLLSKYLRLHSFPIELSDKISTYSDAVAKVIREINRVKYYIHAVQCKTNHFLDTPHSREFIYCVDDLAAEKEEMPVEAQVLMSMSQYEYYSISGLKLAKEAIVGLIKNGASDKFAREIFRLEDVYPMWPELRDILMMRYDVLVDYQRVRREKRQTADIAKNA